MSVRWDLIVVGSGPAGLSAATAAAERDLRVLVLDEHPRPGGRLLGQLHERPGVSGPERWWNGLEVAERLVASALSAGVEIRCREAVWGLEDGWTVLTEGTAGAHCYDAERVLLATGASEDPAPVPGWTLPGVVSIGGAQVLVNVHRVRPASAVVVVGIDLLSVAIARELELAGVEVRAIVLPPPVLSEDPRGVPNFVVPKLLEMARLHPSPLMRGLAAVVQRSGLAGLAPHLFPRAGMPVWGIPVRATTACVHIHGDDAVEGVELAPVSPRGEIGKGRERVEVDGVCIAGGLSPLAELAGAAGAVFAWLPELGGHVPLHGPRFETTREGLYVAGNIIGIEGAEVALAQGEAAGIAICLDAAASGATDADLERAKNAVGEARERVAIRFLDHVDAGRRKLRLAWEGRDGA